MIIIGNRYYNKAFVTLFFLGNSEHSLSTNIVKPALRGMSTSDFASGGPGSSRGEGHVFIQPFLDSIIS